MSKPLKLLLQYGITIIVTLAIGFGYAWECGLLAATLQNRYRILSDAFSVPGLLCLFSGAMIWMSNEGAFNGLTWVVTYAVKSLIPSGRMNRETYGDYVTRNRAKKVSGFGFLLVVGAVEVAISLVFLYLFNSMY